eukprot:6080086-Amphidinium_carterae.1
MEVICHQQQQTSTSAAKAADWQALPSQEVKALNILQLENKLSEFLLGASVRICCILEHCTSGAGAQGFLLASPEENLYIARSSMHAGSNVLRLVQLLLLSLSVICPFNLVVEN